jgi:hypothetical protein
MLVDTHRQQFESQAIERRQFLGSTTVIGNLWPNPSGGARFSTARLHPANPCGDLDGGNVLAYIMDGILSRCNLGLSTS